MWTCYFPGLTPTICNITIVFFLSRSIDEMKRLEEMSAVFQSPGVERHPPEPKSQTEGNEDSGGKKAPWEMVMDKKHFKLWRRPITGSHHYQYRGEPSLAALSVSWLPQVLRTCVPQTVNCLFWLFLREFVMVYCLLFFVS